MDHARCITESDDGLEAGRVEIGAFAGGELEHSPRVDREPACDGEPRASGLDDVGDAHDRADAGGERDVFRRLDPMAFTNLRDNVGGELVGQDLSEGDGARNGDRRAREARNRGTSELGGNAAAGRGALKGRARDDGLRDTTARGECDAYRRCATWVVGAATS